MGHQPVEAAPDSPGSSLDPHEDPAHADRLARRAVTVFPLLVLVAGGVGLAMPSAFIDAKPVIPYLLGLIMFCMGLSMTSQDFRGVVKRPWAVAIGLVAHYVIMPGLGWAIAQLLDLSPQLAIGVILVGCAPSGTASNVVTFLARGDVALAMSIATVSTLVAPLATPFLAQLLAGHSLAVEAGPMVTDILKTVLVPALAGLLVRVLASRLVQRCLPVLPWLSAVTVAAIVLIVIAGSATAIKSAAAVVLLAVVLHNGLGLGLGYGAARLAGMDTASSRAMTFEVGMQNSGLAASLAATYFSPLAALPAAVFSVWHNVSGALVAAWMNRRTGARRPR
ncbi:bile acid:sodium symporter family protein [Streptomyces spongiae]|uniref:Bile acid:sodium symporter family protein n=1 Tax=Streptomyces spongiae TaxID=565072 RepID=A0A5N8XBK3_9ACTN|nr:bile acid:sodium symporter family protein [Streptomyces spongiae]MPY55905.1 bile acid:sodium symporter family protein [Streptomyces spongiae]